MCTFPQSHNGKSHCEGQTHPGYLSPRHISVRNSGQRLGKLAVALHYAQDEARFASRFYKYSDLKEEEKSKKISFKKIHKKSRSSYPNLIFPQEAQLGNSSKFRKRASSFVIKIEDEIAVIKRA